MLEGSARKLTVSRTSFGKVFNAPYDLPWVQEEEGGGRREDEIESEDQKLEVLLWTFPWLTA